MGKVFLFLVCCFLNFFLYAEELSDEKIEAFSEYAGKCIGEGFRYFKGYYNVDAVIRGLRNYEEGKYTTSDLSDEELEAILAIQTELFEKIAIENKQKAETFLCDLSRKAGVKIISDKLIYEQIQEGKGVKRVEEDSRPLLRYSVKMLDGSEISNIFDNAEPEEVYIPDTIDGFAKGVFGMREEECRRLYIHPDLGYKKTGNLPPNALLIVECQVVKVCEKKHEELPA
jgi:FKBP-type peptidyl-prolyl cis-trans isomerase